MKELSSGKVQEKTWASEVWFPVIRLFGIAVIIGLLLWFIDLPAFLKGDAWTDRTVIALILVFSFAAATMINVDDKALTALKDVTLIVVGFYFGSAKVAAEQKEKDKKTDERESNASPKQKQATRDTVTPNPPDADQRT
jgi:Na+/H+ antiporter NhaB